MTMLIMIVVYFPTQNIFKSKKSQDCLRLLKYSLRIIEWCLRSSSAIPTSRIVKLRKDL